MVINSIADLRELARRRVPRAIFDYADRGSYDEITFNRNLDDLHAIQLRQRVMVDVSKQQLATNILGERLDHSAAASGPPASPACSTPMAKCSAHARPRPSACRSA